MACGTENITIEKVWSDVEPFVIYKVPSGYKDKVLMVYENLHDVSIRVVTEEEYRKSVECLLAMDKFEEKRAQEEKQDDVESLNIDYITLDETTFLSHKRSIDIRLPCEVSEDILRFIALKLKASDPNVYERTFIGYYLPGMKVNAGYWATTHFNPSLEVRILGTIQVEVDEEKQSDSSN